MAGFQETAAEFSNRKITLIAASVDQSQDARATVERLGLTFPVASELDAVEVAGLTGAFYSGEKKYLHATGFILNPEGVVEEAVYSTGPIGRLTPQDCLSLIDGKTKKSA